MIKNWFLVSKSHLISFFTSTVLDYLCIKWWFIYVGEKSHGWSRKNPQDLLIQWETTKLFIIRIWFYLKPQYWLSIDKHIIFLKNHSTLYNYIDCIKIRITPVPIHESFLIFLSFSVGIESFIYFIVNQHLGWRFQSYVNFLDHAMFCY